MELQYFGANCLRITTKKAQIVTDDNLASLGLKSVTKPDDISLRSNDKLPDVHGRFTADMPGEYEISGVIIKGIAARSHMEEEGKSTSVIYTLTADAVKIAILGHINEDLSEEQLESIGMVDIAVIPVGNSGYTLDGIGALKVVKQIEPKVVIPVHYADKAINYEVPQTELAEAIKSLGMEPAETVAKYKFKSSDSGDSTQLIILERQ